MLIAALWSLMRLRIATRSLPSNPSLVKSALTLIGKVMFSLTVYRSTMFRAFSPIALLSCVAIALLVPAIAHAAPVAATTPATAYALLTHPISIVKTSDLDFGLLTTASAGTVVIDPNVNSIASTGGVSLAGSQWSAASFVGAAGGGAVVVLIKLPSQAVTVTRQGGTETMTVSNLTLQGLNKRALAALQSFSFRVGGTLNVAANQVEGIYTGTFSVDIQYP